MADLDGPGDRAQILLVTALVLGMMFVTLALILNSAIFTENLASRGETAGGDAVVQYHGDVERSVGAVLAYEDRNVSAGDDHDDVAARVETAVNDTDDVLAKRHAKTGALSNVSMVDRRDGARIHQSDGTRNFSDGDGRADWTVVEDVERTRAFRLNVTGASSTCTPFADCFTVSVSNASHSWDLSVRDTGSQVELEVENVSGGTETCATPGSAATVDVTAGTLAGEPCPALSFADAPTGASDVEYRNADEIAGTYSLVVDNESVATSPPAHFGAGSDPTVRPTLYDVTLAYEYETDDVAVDGELRVAPGEPDA